MSTWAEFFASHGFISMRIGPNDEMNDSQGSAQDLGGYYKGDVNLLTEAMCPSKMFNEILEGV